MPQVLHTAETLPDWPDATRFSTGGNGENFRLPFFQGYYAYPNGEDLFNVLYIPKNYDPQRAYPLCIIFQPQNGAPSPWFGKILSSGKAIVLGISWSATNKDNKNNMKIAKIGRYHIPGTYYWLQSQLNIDTSRIFVGGFSAGGWSATSEAMTNRFRFISTHFVVTGAGIRGAPTYKHYQGNNIFVAAGTNDMNYNHAKKAKSNFEGQGYKVTYFEEPGVGHQLGAQMKVEMAKWFDSFDPEIHAEKWLAESEQLIGNKSTFEQGCTLLASVATLGPNNAHGKQARAKLVELEGEALTACEAAWQLLYQKKYAAANDAFKEAGKLAKKQKSARLLKSCVRGLSEITERQMVEQLNVLDAANQSGRPYQAYMLCADGDKRFGKYMKDFGGSPFGELTNFYKKRIGEVAKPSKEQLNAQKELVKQRFDIWSGKATKKQKSLDKCKEALQEIIDTIGDSLEAREAKELQALLPELVEE